MGKATDIRPIAVSLYFLPVETRVPLKFGTGTVTSVTCARVRIKVTDGDGQIAEGWGETPLNVQWAWPSGLSYQERYEAMKRFCMMLAEAWADLQEAGHPIEVGHAFQRKVLPTLLARLNEQRRTANPESDVEPVPWLAALICCSAFDIALHDAYGVLHQRPVYETYGPPFMNYDLAHYLEPATDSQSAGAQVTFENKYPRDFLIFPRPERLPAWHLVGGLDPLDPSECTGNEPDDGYPVVLTEWVARDGLKCLKVKLRGNDADWDYERLVKVGEIAIAGDVDWLTTE